MQQIWQRIAELFSPKRIGAAAAEFIPSFIVALVTFVALYVVWRFIDRASEAVMERAEVDPTAGQFIQTLIKYVILTVATVTALGQIGINTTSILTSLGIVGLTIGFAARDALSNTISGLFIFWDRPFVIGDLIEIDDHYGRVDNITMRSTRVVTTDGKMLAIPNTTVVNAVVTSYTNFPNLRLDLEFGVAVDEDLDRVRETLLGIVDGDEALMASPAPTVVAKSLNDYNNIVELRVWLEDEQDHVGKRFELREKGFDALNAAGIEMPFETRVDMVRYLDEEAEVAGAEPAPA